jgi:hypothetical protein
MYIDIVTKSMLGHWDISLAVSQCEYQFGRRLVYVQHPKAKSHALYTAKAQKVLVEVWNDIENAVRFAEQHSRSVIPAFWKVHDESQKPGLRFDVYSIHFDLTAPHPLYVISTNHDFEFSYIRYDEFDLWQEEPIVEQLPEPPQNLWLKIWRTGESKFENAT